MHPSRLAVDINKTTSTCMLHLLNFHIKSLVGIAKHHAGCTTPATAP